MVIQVRGRVLDVVPETLAEFFDGNPEVMYIQYIIVYKYVYF